MPISLSITPEFIGIAAGLTYFWLSVYFFDPLITTPLRLLSTCIEPVIIAAISPLKMITGWLHKPGSARQRSRRGTQRRADLS